MPSLPCAPYAGHQSVTGASSDTAPRSASSSAAVAVTAFVHENVDAAGVPLPRPAGALVRDAAPQVDDGPAVDVDRDRRAEVRAVGEVGRERVADAGERRIAGPFHHQLNPR